MTGKEQRQRQREADQRAATAHESAGNGNGGPPAPPAKGKAPRRRRAAKPKPKVEHAPPTGINRPEDSLRVYTAADLALEPRKPVALIRGVISQGAYGPFGGKEKTLKSICACAGAIALASGLPMLNYERWLVPKARPAVIFAGEGGYDLTHRRVQRIAKEVYGIDRIEDLPLSVIEGVAEMNGEYFRRRTREFIATYGQPGLLVLDSLYNFHDSNVEVSNLYARGGMLSEFQHFVYLECGPECGLWVVDHFRKSANSTGLEEYQQSGMAAWADSWWNAQHRQDPDLDQNRFWLNVTIGSRHGYGGLYEIDIDEGPFDDDLMTWLRPMTVSVRRVSTHQKVSADRKMSDTEIDGAIMTLVERGQYTKTDLKELVAASNSRVYARVLDLIAKAQLRTVSEQRGGRRTDIVRPYGKVSMSEARSGNPSRKSSRGV